MVFSDDKLDLILMGDFWYIWSYLSDCFHCSLWFLEFNLLWIALNLPQIALPTASTLYQQCRLLARVWFGSSSMPNYISWDGGKTNQIYWHSLPKFSTSFLSIHSSWLSVLLDYKDLTCWCLAIFARSFIAFIEAVCSSLLYHFISSFVI